MPAIKVFLSSTFLDFREERERLKYLIREILEVACSSAGKLTPRTPNLQKAIERCIDDCEVVVLLIGYRYGSVPEESEMSWTQSEIEYAFKNKKTVFPYLKIPEPGKSRNNEFDVCQIKQRALKDFIEFVRSKVGNIPTFSGLEELIALAIRDVWDVESARRRKKNKDSFETTPL